MFNFQMTQDLMNLIQQNNGNVGSSHFGSVSTVEVNGEIITVQAIPMTTQWVLNRIWQISTVAKANRITDLISNAPERAFMLHLDGTDFGFAMIDNRVCFIARW